jgi:hypothetical protein
MLRAKREPPHVSATFGSISMKTSFLLLALVGMVAFIAGCGGEDVKPPVKPATTPTGGTAPPTTGPKANTAGRDESSGGESDGQPDAAGAEAVLPEMKDFMSTMKGEYEPIDAAREKYTAEGVDTSEMATVMAREPQIIKTEKKDDQVCYTVKLKAGIATHTWTYDQAAIAATFGHTRPHTAITTELHRRAGPLTTVPLPGDTSSLVWDVAALTQRAGPIGVSPSDDTLQRLWSDFGGQDASRAYRAMWEYATAGDAAAATTAVWRSMPRRRPLRVWLICWVWEKA